MGWLDGTQDQMAEKKAQEAAAVQKEIAALDRGQYYPGYGQDRAALERKLDQINRR